MSTLYDPVLWTAGSPVNLTRLDTMDDGIRNVQPVGAMTMWPLASAPPGFLLCDGSEVSRATYPELWDFVNTNGLAGSGKLYGTGNGTTTFDLPDLRQRFPRGTPVGEEAGQTGGAATHTHDNPSTSSVANHTHGNTDTSSAPTHSHTVPSTSSAGSHSHSFSTGTESATQDVATGAFIAADNNHSHSGTTGSGGSHSHSVGNTGSGGGHSHTLNPTDAGGGHSHTQAATDSASSLPPYFNIYFIVAT